MVKIGIIGGSGLEDPQLLKKAEELNTETPFGHTTSPLLIGKIKDVDVVIISRHGKNHQYNPTEVNYRANIHAMKQSGVTHIIGTTACGSLRQEIGRGDFVIPDQFIDFTRHRISTFFDTFKNGMHHQEMAEPFDRGLRKALFETSTGLGFKTHEHGTVITIEGPRFSTKAESKMFRMWEGHVINMSTATEVSLANEVDIPYAAVAMSTDYDCWKENEDPVTWEEVLKIFNKNAAKVKQLIVDSVEKINANF